MTGILRFVRKTATALIFVIAAGGVNAQTASTSTNTTSDPQAVTLAAQSVRALTGGTAVSDVTLTGTATQTAGSWNASGAATFKAKGFAESRVDFAASSQSEIHGLDASGNPAGAWIGSPAKTDSTRHTMALHNSFSDAAWFFPALTSLGAASQAGVVAKYIGAETHNGVATQHVRLWHTASSYSNLAAIATVIPRLSTVDIYLDATSSLPVALAFNAHSDKDMNTDVPIEVRYSDYQAVNGVRIPFHVQKYLNNGLVMDFTASSATINSGLSDALFSTQ
ncbi:MAG TPA: hypothetical protein VK699_05500 [Terriglobales bacterium]|jgi:hypothetical protein|nr:hypothetical protein [Terriglobales bacterium]